MANLKFKSSKSQWESLSVVRGPKGDNANITLNGSSATNASFYAPISSGLSGQILQSKGANESPVWVEHQMPTVNNAVLNIKKNGTSLGTFSANASTNKDIDIEIPTPSDIETLIQTAILASHPIGSIEINITGTNPSVYLGGTWIAWESGRVPVGVDTTQTEFNTVEKISGEKTHTHTTGDHALTVNEMPSHNHGAGSTSGNAVTGRSMYPFQMVTTGNNLVDSNVIVATGGGQAHNHGNTGSSSNLQPYITCYMWKRTA